MVVNIILDKEDLFNDQWIYINSPDVKLGRIQNYKNWSPFMVPDNRKTSLGLEYFCSQNDNLWHMNDIDIINYALEELEKIGIVSRKYFINGFVVRRPHAYPVYSMNYKESLDILLDFLKNFSSLKTIGRGGLFHYDNSDLALSCGMASARIFIQECLHMPMYTWDHPTK